MKKLAMLLIVLPLAALADVVSTRWYRPVLNESVGSSRLHWVWIVICGLLLTGVGAIGVLILRNANHVQGRRKIRTGFLVAGFLVVMLVGLIITVGSRMSPLFCRCEVCNGTGKILYNEVRGPGDRISNSVGPQKVFPCECCIGKGWHRLRPETGCSIASEACVSERPRRCPKCHNSFCTCGNDEPL